MRIGGVFPFGEIASAISLGGGGTFYPTPGNYIVTTGLVTVLQYWDNLTNLWRTLLGPGSGPVPVSMDGTNWRFVNMSGVCNGVAITNAGTAYPNGIGVAATGVTLGFGSAPSAGRSAAGYVIVGGAINSTVAITQAGSGFVVPPHLVFDAPPTGGIKATGHCTLTTGGAIGAVVVDNPGAGYATVPNIAILPQTQFYAGAPSGGAAAPTYPAPGLIGGASGAVLTVNPALSGSGTITGVVMTDYGQGYAGTTIPTVSFTAAGLGSSGAGTAIMSMSMTGASSIVGGTSYTGGSPIFETSLGLVQATDGANGVYLPRAARGTTTVAANAVTALNIEDPGFGFQKVPQIAIINVGDNAATIATATAVVGGIQDYSLIQPAVNT